MSQYVSLSPATFYSIFLPSKKDMEKMVELGLTKAIGVSNYSIKQLRKMKAIAKIPPAVNQVRSFKSCA